jgi:penicillin-binding protein 1B
MRFFLKLFFTVLFILFVFLSFYLMGLDNKIRTTFKGKRWDIPARIYANPLDLYRGLNLKQAEFEDLLEQLHYRQDKTLLSEGSYHIVSTKIELKTRSFDFWD